MTKVSEGNDWDFLSRLGVRTNRSRLPARRDRLAPNDVCLACFHAAGNRFDYSARQPFSSHIQFRIPVTLCK